MAPRVAAKSAPVRLDDRIARAAREAFGYEQAVRGQRDAIAALVGGVDCFAVLPTGAGKSAIYQVAALLRDAGPTVVVSPLIALQRDQLSHLREHELSAAALNSSLRAAERSDALDALADASLQFLLLAPDQPPARCGRCDASAADAVDAPAAEADDLTGTGLSVGARVRHGRWGEGVVQHGDPDKITVAFDDVGYKTLAVALLRERDDLLVPAD